MPIATMAGTKSAAKPATGPAPSSLGKAASSKAGKATPAPAAAAPVASLGKAAAKPAATPAAAKKAAKPAAPEAKAASGKAKASATPEAQVTVETVRALERSLRSGVEHLNDMPQLLEYLASSQDEVAHAAMHSAYRVFQPYMESGAAFRGAAASAAAGAAADKTPAPAAATVVQRWMREKFTFYVDDLLDKLSHVEPGIQVPALDLLMQIVAAESRWLSAQDKSHTVANELLAGVMRALLESRNWNDQLLGAFLDKYANTHDDVRFYTYRNLAKMMQQGAVPANLTPSWHERAYALLAEINMATKAEELDSFLCGQPPAAASGGEAHPLLFLPQHRREFSTCWLTFLRQPHPDAMVKRMLVNLDRDVVPHLANPALLIDFLTDAYNLGGVTSILALNGLYYLIRHCNLDYPDFFPKLYSLLEPSLMFVKYRARFFRLTDEFLQSPLLPAYLVAAFIKRLAQLALVAPPPAILTNLALIYNLILRHPACVVLIHRDAAQACLAYIAPTPAKAVHREQDPFDPVTNDPAKCNALASSLWELQVLKQHYDPAVARMAGLFEQPFRPLPQDLEYYLTLAYPTMFEREMKRPSKEAVTPVNVNVPTVLFGENGVYSAAWQTA